MKKLFTTLILLLAVALNLPAQNVHISPETGHLIAAVTYDDETGFQNGFSALWRHDQLGLSMVVADDAKLTNGGEIANPAGNLNIVNNMLTLTGGQSADCFMVVSLPKGYRFTGYSITLKNNMNEHNYSRSFYTQGVKKTFYETGAGFDYNNPNAYTDEMPATDDSKDYTMKRNASSKTDMGNRLYFRLHKDNNVNNRYYGVSISSFVIYFAADASFDQPLQALPFSTPVGVATSPFMVGKPELGTIKPNTKNNVTYYSYNYRNVDDLEADNLLYQANAVDEGVASDKKLTTKTITRTINLDGLNQPEPWFALSKGATEEDNTYYVETPVTLTSTSGKKFPTGYRIVGATFEFGYGQPDNGGNTIGVNRHGEITYLHADGTMDTSSPVTGWSYDSSTRRLTLTNERYNNARIYIARNNGVYYLTTNSSNSTTSTFYVDSENRIYTRFTTRSSSWPYSTTTTTLYIHESSIPGERAVLNSDPNYAAQLMPYSGFTPSANGYTATIYDKDGSTVNKTLNISSTNLREAYTIEGLNNDAVKFKISGLSDNSQALVRITLKMEHLNPYIHTMDVIGKDANDPTQDPLTNNFSADNFNVRGGHFVFNVPEGTAGHTWNFEFDNLTSNYTDNTYPGNNGGNSRVSFVESKYFKANENLYDGYNPDYTPVSDKLQVVTVGTVPFRFNNADQLSNENESEFESQLEEYPFTVAGYKENSGYTDEDGNVIHGDFQQLSLKAGQENIAYIIVADETRYNIAPTTATQHRYYAHYAMDIELEEKEYQLTVEPVKIYNKTFFTDDDNNEVETSQWGVKVSTTEAGGYARLTDIIDKLTNICDGKQYAGLDTCKQFLYVDLSSLQSIYLPSTGGRTDYFYQFREMMAPNCLIYLPNSTGDKVDNYANKPKGSNTFTANANIIITDKKPFFAPYDIAVPAEGYAKYTREISHSSNGKEKLTTLVLPFQFTVENNGQHTNQGAKGDGKKFTVCKLASENVISKDSGTNPFDDFRHDVVSYNEFVHFNIFEPSNKKSEAYMPYLIYINSSEQLEGDENFTVLEYGANVTHTDREGTGDTDPGKVKIVKGDTSTGTLDGTSFTITPTSSMAGCILDKNQEPSLYFAADRFRSSWTLIDKYNYLYCFPFRSWFAYSGNTNAKNNDFGIAFGESGEATGIDDIKADETEKTGTYKFIRNGQLYIHTDNGVFTVDGRKVNM